MSARPSGRANSSLMRPAVASLRAALQVCFARLHFVSTPALRSTIADRISTEIDRYAVFHPVAVAGGGEALRVFLARVDGLWFGGRIVGPV